MTGESDPIALIAVVVCDGIRRGADGRLSIEGILNEFTLPPRAKSAKVTFSVAVMTAAVDSDVPRKLAVRLVTPAGLFADTQGLVQRSPRAGGMVVQKLEFSRQMEPGLYWIQVLHEGRQLGSFPVTVLADSGLSVTTLRRRPNARDRSVN